MTTLIAQRPRHRVGHAVSTQQTLPQAPAEPNLIAWHVESDGIWTGRFDLLDAGTVRRTAAGYAVEAWDGAPEGVFPTLAAAQLSLEPAHRARMREEAEAARHHAALRAAVAIAGLAGLTVAAATGVLTAFPL
jgi:hypothetical protein